MKTDWSIIPKERNYCINATVPFAENLAATLESLKQQILEQQETIDFIFPSSTTVEGVVSCIIKGTYRYDYIPPKTISQGEQKCF